MIHLKTGQLHTPFGGCINENIYKFYWGMNLQKRQKFMRTFRDLRLIKLKARWIRLHKRVTRTRQIDMSDVRKNINVKIGQFGEKADFCTSTIYMG